MQRTFISIVTAAALASSASAGFVTHVDTASGDRTPWLAALSGTPTALTGANATQLLFGTTTATVSSNDGGNFYLGAYSGLTNASAYFDAGNIAAPGDSETIRAFGNNSAVSNSNDLIITFNPGVVAFGFNFDDISDAGNTSLLITWSDGTTHTEELGGGGNLSDGFFGLVSDVAISEIRLQQAPNLNDGYGLWNFSVVAVPLPTATAMAGVGLLAVGARRRRA